MIESAFPVGLATDQHLPGCVLTVAKREEVIVWLIGEIDSSLGLELAEVAEHAPRVARRLVVDGSRVTFCDSTLAHFIRHTSQAIQVFVRRPSQLVVDLLVATDLYDQVIVETEESLS